MRQALTPGGPMMRIVVVNSRERRTVAVMLSSDRLIAIASNPIFGAIISIHCASE